jgi:hypothetical protein
LASIASCALAVSIASEIAVGGDAAALEEDMLDVNLDEWLRGKDLPIAHLEGQLGGMPQPFEWPIPRAGKKKDNDRRPRARRGWRMAPT